MLWRVELPNALPLILGGIRSATLQVIATATIAAYVSLGGLGRFVIDGNNSGAGSPDGYPQMAAGAIMIARAGAGRSRACSSWCSGWRVSPGLRNAATRKRTAAHLAAADTGFGQVENIDRGDFGMKRVFAGVATAVAAALALAACGNVRPAGRGLR